MDTKKYRESKALGNTEIIKAGGGFAYATKRWDPNTGELVAPEIVAIDVEKLDQQKADLLEQIADIDAIKADIELL